MPKVLLIDNYDSFTFNLAQLINENVNTELTILKNDNIDINKVEQYDKIIISPGPGVPNEAGEIKSIIEKFGPNKSILGICLGHQAIAEVYGGNIYNLSSVYHGFRCNVNILDETLNIFKNLPKQFKAGLYHSWAVNEPLPTDLLKIAISDIEVIMGIKHIKYDVIGLQFHPESYMTEHGKKIIQNWLD